MVFFSSPCQCTASNGNPKRRYDTRSEAESTARHVESERGVRLRVYRCPEGRGYHLTSSTNWSGHWR